MCGMGVGVGSEGWGCFIITGPNETPIPFSAKVDNHRHKCTNPYRLSMKSTYVFLREYLYLSKVGFRVGINSAKIR